MAIRLKTLEKIAKSFTEQSYVFKDLSLDLTTTVIDSPGFPLPVPGEDIRASFDLAAIRNSLQNLFNTKPGQRFLFPEYGIDLYRFLFQPITETNGDIIGNLIVTTINTYEPRVNVQNIQVIVKPDDNEYVINILLNIPSLNIDAVFESVLNIKQQSFIILPNSKNR